MSIITEPLISRTPWKAPRVSIALIQLLAVPHGAADYVEQIGAVVERDSRLSAAGRVTNLSALGGPMGPASIDALIDRADAERFVSMVTANQLLAVFVPSSPAMCELWYHAISVATIAREIVAFHRLGDLAPERAYLAGLFHDVGAMVMALAASEDYRSMLQLNSLRDDSIRRIERERFGSDHVEIGAQVAAALGVPEDIRQAVALHHDRAACTEAAPHLAVLRLAMFVEWAVRERDCRESLERALAGGSPLVRALRIDASRSPFLPGRLDELAVAADKSILDLGVPVN